MNTVRVVETKSAKSTKYQDFANAGMLIQYI